jgi:SAM-dependent methyltransferase
VALNCPVCSRRVDAPFVEIPGVPVHVSTLHRTPDGARTAYRGDLELEFCESCGFIWNAAYDAELVTYDTAYEASLDHSPAFVEYVSSLAERLVERYSLHGSRVVEIGCGQADFLRRLCDAGFNEGIGYDPAYVGPETDGRVTVHRELYSEETVGGTAPDFICCRHVLEHVERPLEFVRSLRRTLHARRGTPVYFEVPNGEYQLANGVVWDMIYAHFSTFTAPSLRALFELGGFEVVETGTAFGDQYLWIEARPAPTVRRTPSSSDVERVRALAGTFASGYERLVRSWRRRVHGYTSAGRRVVLWGAGAKGVSLLNALEPTNGIGRVVDVNPRKQGSYVPGSGTPVVAPESLPEYAPDVVVLANPIYRDEVRAILDGLGQRADVVCV